MQKGTKSFNVKNARFLVVILLSLAFFFSLFTPVLAIEVGVEEVSETIELGETDIRVIVARIINVFLGILGVVALLLVLYGGFLWMTAGGVPERVEKAKKVLINAAIGLGIILTSWAITWFIFNVLLGDGGSLCGRIDALPALLWPLFIVGCPCSRWFPGVVHNSVGADSDLSCS